MHGISCHAQEAGVQLAELDWMVCNGGADIWHLLPARGDKEATWAADEQWDAHISFRHEKFSDRVSDTRAHGDNADGY